ncbi:DinB family protein [Kaistella montana]|nr:DinB family protein [Kaistella montana]
MDHKQILHDGLRRQRAALLQKLEGLSERDARLPRTPTGTNLLGLVKHAAVIELEYFGETFGRPAEVQLPWAVAGQPEEDNVDMFAAEGESLEDVLEFARRCFAHADATITALGADAPGGWRGGPTTRRRSRLRRSSRTSPWTRPGTPATRTSCGSRSTGRPACAPRGTTCPRGTPTAGPPTWSV